MRAEARHQLKQDRFAATTFETFSWAVEHRKNLIMGGAAAALVAQDLQGAANFVKARIVGYRRGIAPTVDAIQKCR